MVPKTMGLSFEDPVGALYHLIFQNGKRYFGISIQPEKRFKRHLSTAKRGVNNPVHKAIRKYGKKKVQFRVLVVGRISYLRELEIAAIQHFDTRIPGGYNLTFGGDLSPMLSPEVRVKLMGKLNCRWKKGLVGMDNGMFGKRHSMSTRKRMSISGRGKRTGKKNGMFGRRHSPETLQKMSDLKKGKKNPMWGRVKI